MRASHVFIPLAILAVAALARPSRADRRGLMGQVGAACRPVLGASAAHFGGQGDIQNRGPAPEAVVCPVARDSGYEPGGPLEVSVTVRSDLERRLSCTLHSLGSAGQLIAAFSRSTYSATPTALGFTMPRAYVGFAGSAYVLCTLPPGGAVISYYAGEAIDVRREGDRP